MMFHRAFVGSHADRGRSQSRRRQRVRSTRSLGTRSSTSCRRQALWDSSASPSTEACRAGISKQLRYGGVQSGLWLPSLIPACTTSLRRTSGPLIGVRLFRLRPPCDQDQRPTPLNRSIAEPVRGRTTILGRFQLSIDLGSGVVNTTACSHGAERTNVTRPAASTAMISSQQDVPSDEPMLHPMHRHGNTCRSTPCAAGPRPRPTGPIDPRLAPRSQQSIASTQVTTWTMPG